MHSVGIVGAGKIARVHGANAAGLDGLRIAAVADIDPVSARGLAEELGCDIAPSVDVLLARDDVEAS